MKDRIKNLPFKTRLRMLGHELGLAELYGSNKDLTAKKRAHAQMLRKFYQGVQHG
jgi:hypothetical protein